MGKEHKVYDSAHQEQKVESKSAGDKVLGFSLATVVIILVLVLVAALVGTYVGYNTGLSSEGAFLGTTSNASVDTSALKAQVGDYINKNLITDSTVTAVISDVNDLGDGLFEIGYSIIQNGAEVAGGSVYAQGNTLLIGQKFDMSKALPKPEVQPTASVEPIKTAKPVVDLYVMSFCPYGNQAEDTMFPVYNLLKDKAEFNVHYIVSVNGNTVNSLHGAPEVTQNEREACVAKYYDMNKWFYFTTMVNDNCGSDGSCWESAATVLGLDIAKINACVASEGVSLMTQSQAASSAVGATGSPTLLINGAEVTKVISGQNVPVVYAYGDSEGYKKAICDSFTTAPGECNTALSASTSTVQGGSC